MVHGRQPGVRALRALHELTGAAILLLLVAASPAEAQDGSGPPPRGVRQLTLPDGYQAEVLARGLRQPQDLAVDPPDGLWVLTQTAPGGDRGAGALVRVPLGAAEPVDASRLPVVVIPFASATVPFEAGSLARHPGSGNLYVTEARGRHLYQVTREGGVTVFAQGGNALGDGRAIVFDAQGRLLVLDNAGRSIVAETPDPLRDLFGASEPYQGPVVHWLRVEETLPLPRNLEYAGVLFPPAAFRRRRVVLPRYSSLAALPSGTLIASLSNGVIDQLRPDGTIARVAQLSGAGAVVAGATDVLYALDYLGGRIVRVRADGTVEPFAQGLTRPAALAVLTDGGVIVAEDTGRLLRISGHPVPR
ncbi:MAG TPA: hypothetical protein VIE44_10620 [Methylomirabilota bacterium]